MARRFYGAKGDCMGKPYSVPFLRYGKEHHILQNTSRVQAATGGGWEVMARIEGPCTYNGTLWGKILEPQTVQGRPLTFRTRANALAACTLHLGVQATIYRR